MVADMTSKNKMPMLYNSPHCLDSGIPHGSPNLQNTGVHLWNKLNPRVLNDPAQRTHTDGGLVDNNVYAKVCHTNIGAQEEALAVPQGSKTLTLNARHDTTARTFRITVLMKKLKSRLKESYSQLRTHAKE